MEICMRLLLIFGIIVLLTGIWRGKSSMAHSFHLERNASILRQHITQLTQENQQLAQEILKLKNSKSYAKKVLRDKYHLVDTDENIVFFGD